MDIRISEYQVAGSARGGQVLMEQGFRYENDCLSKKEETTCICNGNSGENPKRFNGERARKNRYGVPNGTKLRESRLKKQFVCQLNWRNFQRNSILS